MARLRLATAGLAALLGCKATTELEPVGGVPIVPPAVAEPVLAEDPEERPARSRPQDYVELLANVQRVSFPRSAGRRAAELLDGGRATGTVRAAALYALGAAGSVSERWRLEQALADPDPMARAAAMFALAELPDPRADLLLEQSTRALGGELSMASQLALVLADAEAARVQVESWIALGGARAQRLGDYRRFLAEPTEATPGTAFDLYQRLRWEAGKRFGLVDLQSWRALELDTRLADEDFLDLAVLGAIRGASTSAVGDHLVALLETRPSEAAVRAAVRILPAELDQLLTYGLFEPRTPERWRALLDEIDRQGPSTTHLIALGRGLATPGHQVRAAGLLLRLRDPDSEAAAWEVLEPLLSSQRPEDRTLCADALGGSGNDAWVEELNRLREDPDPSVLAAGLVARVRLGDGTAERRVVDLLENPDGPAYAPLVEALCRPLERFVGLRLVEERLPDLEGDLRLQALMALGRHGDDDARRELYEVLDEERGGERTAECARVLGLRPGPQDLELFARMFPADGDPALDAVLVDVLVRERTPLGKEVLREALWRDDVDRGVLAALAIAQGSGLNELWDELEIPPRGADEGDLRRLGYAIGLIGGVTEVERLARSRSQADPVVQGVYLGALTARTRGDASLR